jgi:ferredoxin
MGFLRVFRTDAKKRTALATGHVVPDAARCVQCGICSYNCPIDIDVRAYVWRDEAITNSECLTCGECVARCPRGVLRFTETDLFARRGDE